MTDQGGSMSKPEKKSEAIEIRVPYETKQRFMEACGEQGKTVSEVLRGLISGYLDNRQHRTRKYLGLASSLILGIGIGAVVLWQFDAAKKVPVGLNPLAVRYFEMSDTNKDLHISLGEFVEAISTRGTISQDLDEYELALRSGIGVALLTSKKLGDRLQETSQLDRCFEAIAEIGDADTAREFYALDRDADSMLSLNELARSARIPTLAQLQETFSKKDLNADGVLDRSEAQENLQAWLAANAGPENAYTQSKYQDIPEACIPEGFNASDGQLYSKFEQLKQRIDILTEEAESPVDGLSDERFANLDKNSDKHLSFHEFLEWYL